MYKDKIEVQSGKILTKDNKIVIAPKYNLNITSRGLTNHYKSGDYIVAGTCASQWTDSISGNNMVQANASYQPYIYTNTIDNYSSLGYKPGGGGHYMTFTGTYGNAMSMFIVVYRPSISYGYLDSIFGSNTNASQQGYYISNGVNQNVTNFFWQYGHYFNYCYANAIPFTPAVTTFALNKFYIVYTEFTSKYVSSGFLNFLGIPGYGCGAKFLEVLFYNRPLLTEEIVHTTNALNAKFNIY